MADAVLAKIDKAKAYLAAIVSVEDVMEVMGMAEAAQAYAKRVGSTVETINYAAEIRLRSERKLGEILIKTPKAKGTRGQLKGSSSGAAKTEAPEDPTPTLTEVGISYKLSSQAQELANAPEEEFEAALKVGKKELNRNKVLKDLKTKRQTKKRTTKRKAAASKCKDMDKRIIVGDFRKHTDKVPDGSLSLIFTDPPYDRKALKMFPDLAEFAKAKLADGGSLLCYVGHIQLPTALSIFQESLRYWWTICCLHQGGKNLMREYGIRAAWKPILWFVKETRDNKEDIVIDVVSGGQEKDDHEWQQAESEAAYWIEHLTPKDGMVCDPFLGSGTTAIAANLLKRKWTAFEIDPDTAKAASERIKQ